MEKTVFLSVTIAICYDLYIFKLWPKEKDEPVVFSLRINGPKFPRVRFDRYRSDVFCAAIVTNSHALCCTPHDERYVWSRGAYYTKKRITHTRWKESTKKKKLHALTEPCAVSTRTYVNAYVRKRTACTTCTCLIRFLQYRTRRNNRFSKT